MPALMYHDVVPSGAEDSSGFPGRDAALYKITPAQFEAHLAAIERRVGHDSGPPALAITFDDGGVSAMTAAEMLEAHRLIGWFFVTVNYLGTPGFLAAQHLRELRARGHVVGSHSCSHPLRFAHCPPGQVLEEWTRSRAVLADVLGLAPTAASVPGGDFASHVAEAAAVAGYTHLFTSEPVVTPRRAHGLMLHGRFTIQRWTSPHTAAALATGAWPARARQTVAWTTKKIGKQLGGERYLTVRRLLLGHGKEVRWGDS
jgi:peptidoglycan/xylan/chitin deacetylase (PgdA/CDA1 family)